MKKLILFFCVLLAAAQIKAQQITLLDKSTKDPIVNAAVYTKGGAAVTTNEKGRADISSMAAADTIFVRHPAYGTNAFSSAQLKSMNYKLALSSRYIMMDEVVFSANKSEEKKDDVAYEIAVVPARAVETYNPQNSSDMLVSTGQVFAQKSQMGGGSPVLRGFEASRVLMVVDGVRMNNAIYRAGHLQDAITVDPNMLERTEVVFGPASVIYGSDALGGVMHFYTKRPVLGFDDKTYVGSNAMTRYSTANEEKTAHVDFNIGLKKIAFLTSFTFSDFGDLRAGNLHTPYDTAFGKRYFYVDRINGRDTMISNPDPNVQVYTGYSQYDITEKILFKQSDKVSHLLNFQLSNSSNIPRYDRLTQMQGPNLRFAEWNYGPQKRMLASYTLGLTSPEGRMYDKANIILAFQDIDQERITRRFNSVMRNDQLEEVTAISLNADLQKTKGKNELRYGAEFVYNSVVSTATDTDIEADTTRPAITRYPDGDNSMMFAAVYATYNREISEKLIFSAGLRGTMISLESNWVDTTFFPFPFSSVKQTSIAPSGSIGLVFKPRPSWRFHVLGSSGFRAPNVDDMTKVFESVPGTLIVPNPELKPEYAYNAEIGMSKTLHEIARLDVTYFYTIMTNAIVAKDFTLNGQDSVLYEGAMSQVQAPQNVNNAWIYGINSMFTADFTENFAFRATINYTYGRYEDTENDTIVPLDHIPPIYGRVGLVYKERNFELEGYTFYNGWKRLKDYSPSGEDNLNQAMTPEGAPAWYTLNARASYQFGKYIRLGLALENITDLHYRVFASGISAPGRNFVVSLRGKF